MYYPQIFKKKPQSNLHRTVVCSNLSGSAADARSQICIPRHTAAGARQPTNVRHEAFDSDVRGPVAAPKPEIYQCESLNISIGDNSCIQHRPSCLATRDLLQPNSPVTSSAHRSTVTSAAPNKPKTLTSVSSEGQKVAYLQHSNFSTKILSSESMGEPSNMSGPTTYTPPMSPLCGRVLSSPLSPSPLPGHLGSSASLFSISPYDAAQLVTMVKTQDSHDARHCYFIHLKLRTVFSDDAIPGSCIRKLPRLLNGIPLGAGFLSRDQISEIRWRLVEGEHSTLTFLSCPLLRDEAEESRTSFRDRLITQAQAVFGDITVRASLSLSKCLDYHDDLILNDIATNVGDGLQFKD